MPNQFLCNGNLISVSNAGTVMLFKHWLRLLDEMPDREAERLLRSFLIEQTRLAEASSGISGFSLDRPHDADHPLSNKRVAYTLLKVIRKSAEDVRRIEMPGGPRAWDETIPKSEVTRAEYWEDVLWTFHMALAAWTQAP